MRLGAGKKTPRIETRRAAHRSGKGAVKHLSLRMQPGKTGRQSGNRRGAGAR